MIHEETSPLRSLDATDATGTASAATARPVAGGRPRFWWMGTVAALVLGAVLLVAVWAKMLDPLAFAEQIRQEKLDFLLSAEAVALIALALEAGLGLALVLNVRRLWVLVPTTLLVAFFLFLTGRTYWLDSQGLLDNVSSCGCFGNLVQRTPAQAFWQDLAMLLPPLLLSFVGRDGRGQRGRLFPPVRTAAVAVAGLGAMAFAWKAPELPLDDLATRLRPGVAVTGLCAGGEEGSVCLDQVASGIEEGEHLVILADLEDPALTGEIDGLNAWANNPQNPRLWVLSASEDTVHRAFFWQWGPSFEVVETPAELMRPLYRRLPRSFLVKDGRVTRTFSGMPPLTTPAAPATSTASATSVTSANAKPSSAGPSPA